MPPKKAASTKRAAAGSTSSKPPTRATTKAAPKATTKATTKSATKATTKANTKSAGAVNGTKPGRGRARKDTAAETATKEKPASTAASKPAKGKLDEPVGANTSRKRKPTAAPSGRPAKRARAVPKINEAPQQKLDVYVFGEGSSGELGLGTARLAIDVKRPRLNPNLSADSVGVVQIAAGGMHVVALTHSNQILTWGVNDQGALGRDTTWSGGRLKDADAQADDDDDDEDDDTGMNPHESTPGRVDPSNFPEGTKFVQVAAGDSTSFALTEEGLVYGWGTFRSNEGIFGFSKTIHVQKTPIHVPELKNIKHIACGANHVLALDAVGNVFAWGSGQQNQLGRRVIERTKIEGLVPREFGLPKRQITHVACGDYHSFAVDKTGNVWSWGLNSYGETGIQDNAGDDTAIVLKPQKVDSLAKYKITHIKGGAHHSVGVTEDGACLVWGRADGCQMGIKIENLPKDDLILDEREKPRILAVPTKVPITKTAFATCGSDHSIAVTRDGRAYSWGFSANYQTGQGKGDDVEEATHIDNTAVRGKKLVWAGAGGQYSILAGIAGEAGAKQEAVNGVA